ncbi:MAG TPA: hypothetical protein VHJ38_19710 [Nitrososphaeraceae archaeon]|jgi:hypothetical protein|nr:hypothetical protein [Nitrososphaeraceae archaeon]
MVAIDGIVVPQILVVMFVVVIWAMIQNDDEITLILKKKEINRLSFQNPSQII